MLLDMETTLEVHPFIRPIRLRPYSHAVTYETFGLGEALEELVAVARYEHVTRAAESLGIPQPTLSRSMSRLSQAVGTPLLQRDGRGVRLTRHGRILAAASERALAEVLAGVRAVRAEIDPDSGTVVLGFLHSMGPLLVPTLLRSFAARHPGIRVQIRQGSADDLVTQLVLGRIDLCLVAPTPPRRGQIRFRALADQPLVLLVPDGHRLASRTHIRLRELAGEPLITLTHGYGLRAITDRLLTKAGVSTEYGFEAQEMTTAAGFVAAGLGLALLPAGAQVEDTTELAIVDDGASRTISLVWSGDDTGNAPVQALRRHLIDEAPAKLAPPPT
jgi:LysR family transcriptional activator of glutamate synthase operon